MLHFIIFLEKCPQEGFPEKFTPRKPPLHPEVVPTNLRLEGFRPAAPRAAPLPLPPPLAVRAPTRLALHLTHTATPFSTHVGSHTVLLAINLGSKFRARSRFRHVRATW